MFPPVYNRSTSASSTASSCPDNSLHDEGIAKPSHMTTLFKHETELEPFEFRPTPTPIMQSSTAIPVSTSLSSVFGDQDLIDAIMFSLNMEHGGSTATPSPRFVVPRIQQVQVHTPQTFGAMLRQANGAPTMTSRMKAPLSSGPCLRKPGTFLNKDGRWIKGKPCRMEGCDKRAQSNGLCKGHGGGARCSFAGCSKSSQGGGFCRAHGGGKRCMHEGCEKGTQRNGFCYLHGGVRSCSVEGCDKKDRGNGKCFSHGGGRKCQAHMCLNTIRRGAFCDLHNGK
ncbi:hypothetical protein PHYBOEH_002029 [Phytophthora boehmeriae]|uniref:WRKY19-like zinc finger domain-containing protein n=1 Tax=Phytophthora boehmeriae TaxID=109152 RepID=A0A8T1WXU7_9STRA|nr:hypothetical protein PHYBOEH_002029 [Phytophthora boehmeriae]